jgi:hypothetical protein
MSLLVIAFLALPVSSGALYAKRPSFEEAVDFIFLKLSGKPVASRVQCDTVPECRGFVDTVWQTQIAPSPAFCAIEVIQTINVTKTQNEICVWTDDVIRGKRWNQVTYHREFRFQLDFASISRDGITIEQAPPVDSRCSSAKSNLQYSLPQSDLPYSIHLNFTRGVDVGFQLKETGSGNGYKTTSEQKGTDTWNNDSIAVGSQDLAERVARAFKRAAALCGAKKEVF